MKRALLNLCFTPVNSRTLALASPAIAHRLRRAALICLFSIASSISLTANAETNTPIEVVTLSDYQDDQRLLVDAKVQFNLPASVLEAIQHEIPITFETEIELNEQFHMFGFDFNRQRKQVKYQTQLEFFGYNQSYVLVNKRNKRVQSFSSVDEALNTLGTLSNFYLADLADLHPNTVYSISIRVSLNQWQLPTPLIMHALIEQNWQLDSGWRTIKIQSPKSWL